MSLLCKPSEADCPRILPQQSPCVEAPSIDRLLLSTTELRSDSSQVKEGAPFKASLEAFLPKLESHFPPNSGLAISSWFANSGCSAFQRMAAVMRVRPLG